MKKFTIRCVNKESAQTVHTLAKMAGSHAVHVESPLDSGVNHFKVIALFEDHDWRPELSEGILEGRTYEYEH